MSREQVGKGKKNVEATLNKKDVHQNSIFEKYSESELIAQLKRFALDPCCPQFALDNIRPLYNHILLRRKVVVLNHSDIPWRKRKLEQLVKDKPRAPSSLTIPDQQNISIESRQKLSHSTTMSYLANVSKFAKSLAEKTTLYSHSSNSLSTFDDHLLENCQDKDMVIDSDFDESVIDSSPPTTHNSSCPASYEPNKKNLNLARKSKRLTNFIGDHLQKCIVPLGPRFQADVPEFSGTFDKNTVMDQYKINPSNSKWLGTQIWPIGNVKNIDKQIGKGRNGNCQCKTPNSVECVKRHSLEAWVFLRCDLGPAFFSWKFDEMGELIAKLWTSKEQQIFESQMKIRPLTNGKDFVKRALKSIPWRSRKEIVNYYFNVYISRRISVQTRSSSKEVVDSDVEEEPEGYKGKVATTSKSKRVNDQYYLRVFP